MPYKEGLIVDGHDRFRLVFFFCCCYSQEEWEMSELSVIERMRIQDLVKHLLWSFLRKKLTVKSNINTWQGDWVKINGECKTWKDSSQNRINILTLTEILCRYFSKILHILPLRGCELLVRKKGFICASEFV